MLITEHELRRILSLHMKERYNIDLKPDEMEWDVRYDHMHEQPWVNGVELGIDVVGDAEKQDSETTFDADSGVTICNNCGATDADNPGHNITHHPTCRKGESKKWERTYSEEVDNLEGGAP